MRLIGETIQHQQFGKGVVVYCDRGIITIDFGSSKKSFVYPDAFEGFLVPQDTDSKQEMNGLLAKRKLEEKQRELENLEHQKKMAHLRSIKIPAAGQAVFDLPCQGDNDPFTTGICSTGTYLSGFSKGQPRIPDRVHFNSLCILTACPSGEPENQRQILGVAMAEESFSGEDCEDGQIPMHSLYRLKLPKPLTIWPYMEKEPRKAWGHTCFKYISNKIGEEILYDIRTQLMGTEKEELAKKFYRYYCACNRLTAR